MKSRIGTKTTKKRTLLKLRSYSKSTSRNIRHKLYKRTAVTQNDEDITTSDTSGIELITTNNICDTNKMMETDQDSEMSLIDISDNDTSSDYDILNHTPNSEEECSDTDSYSSHVVTKKRKLDPYKQYKQTSYMTSFIEYYIGLKTENNLERSCTG